MQPLEISVEQYGTANPQQIRDCLARNLPQLVPSPFMHDGTLVLVGSGLSVLGFADEIREHQEKGRCIWAIKEAHEFLTGHNIIPDGWVNCDPRSDRIHTVATPNDQTVYMLASRCHAEMFDHLKGRQVLVWHSISKEEENKVLQENQLVAVGGGTTSGLRAVNLGYILGFRKIILYGYDSCNVGGYKAIGGRKTGKTIDVHVGERKFICNYAMAQQAKDFQDIYDVMPDLEIESRGDGLISTIIEERNKTST